MKIFSHLSLKNEKMYFIFSFFTVIYIFDTAFMYESQSNINQTFFNNLTKIKIHQINKFTALDPVFIKGLGLCFHPIAH